VKVQVEPTVIHTLQRHGKIAGWQCTADKGVTSHAFYGQWILPFKDSYNLIGWPA
jgi:hypothetical protein